MVSSSSPATSSRFSSFKVLSFPSLSNTRPPPPPPKEFPPFNKSSWISSSQSPPPSLSLMNTPEISSFSPLSSASLPPEPYSSSLKKNFIKLAKRSFSTKPSPPDHAPSPTSGDEGISLPWNFQHNIHVDEVYNGLPPSWTSSLADLGYNEDEIEAINYRRALSRPLFSNQHPLPSSSSQSTRSLANSSLRSYSLHPDESHVSGGSALPLLAPRKSSIASISSHRSSPSSTSIPEVQVECHAPMPSHNESATKSLADNSSPAQSYPPPRKLSLSKTSPKSSSHRAANFKNGTPPTTSPPAYRPSLPPPPIPSSRTNHDHQRSPPVGSTSSTSTSTNGTSTATKGLLRLSLGQDAFTDITTWTDSLLSSVAEATTTDAVSSEGSSSKPLSNLKDTRTILSPAGSPWSYESSHKQTLSAQNAAPDMSTIMEPAKPLPAAPMQEKRAEEHERVSPIGPARISKVSGNLNEEHDMSDVGTPVDDDRDYRDSTMSSATLTNATIIRGVELATWTRANVIKTPSPTRGGNNISNPMKPSTETSVPKPQGVPVLAIGEDSPTIVTRPPSTGSSSYSHSSFVMSSSSSMGSLTMPSSMSSGSRPPTAAVVIQVLHDEDEREKKKVAFDGSPVNESLPESGEHQCPSVDLRKTNGDTSFVDFDDDDEPPAPPVVVSPLRPVKAGTKKPAIQIDELEEPGRSRPTSGTSTMDHLLSAWPPTAWTPSTSLKYPGWLSEILTPLEEFIDDKTDPREYYVDLKEIAEGESGYVYAARVNRPLKVLSPQDEDGSSDGYVAIKAVPILPSGSPKLADLKKELSLLKNVKHPHVLTMDSLYVDLAEDSLWIRMELMERSLADMVTLVEKGIVIPEKVIARFAGDIVSALIYLQKMRIAHRDLRSDNLLLNKDGVLKLADFSKAVKVTAEAPTCSDMAGVLHWQAPEVRTGPYDPLKADIWSLGATAWEMAQGELPFHDAKDASDLSDRWPTLRQPEIYSRSFHDFLHACSHPVKSRPDPETLLLTAFIRSASRRSAVVQLLTQCKSIESDMQ